MTLLHRLIPAAAVSAMIGSGCAYGQIEHYQAKQIEPYQAKQVEPYQARQIERHQSGQIEMFHARPAKRYSKEDFARMDAQTAAEAKRIARQRGGNAGFASNPSQQYWQQQMLHRQTEAYNPDVTYHGH